MARLQKGALSLPNLLTYGRVAAIPAVMLVMAFDSPRNAFIAAMIFAAAAATDALDGWLARRFNLVSIIGKFLDPLADKLIVMAVLLMLLQLGRVSVWVVAIIMVRETTITSLRAIAASEGMVISARQLGKQKTAFQMVGLWFLIVHHPYLIEIFDDPIDFHRVGIIFLYCSVILSVISAIDYFVSFARSVRAQQAAETQAEATAKMQAEAQADAGHARAAVPETPADPA